MGEGLDTGDILLVQRTPIGPEETAGELFDRLAPMGADCLKKTVRALEEKRITPVKQDEQKATYAPMLNKDMSPIDWNKSPREISCQVRGLIPWPVATMELGGKPCKVFSVRPVEKTTEKAPGTPVAVTKKGLEMACGGGSVLLVEEVQAQGGKRMRCADYLRGHPITIED